MKDFLFDIGKSYVLIVFVLIPICVVLFYALKRLWKNIFVYLYEEAKKDIKNMK